MSKSVLKVAVVFMTMSLCVVGLACGGGFITQVDLASLPAAINFVIANQSTFSQSGSNPLAGVDAGTVVDSLNNLDGCWGTFGTLIVESTDNQGATATATINNYEVYQFDLVGGTLQRQLYQSTTAPLVGELTSYASYDGSIVLASDSRIDWAITAVMFSNPFTGELETSTTNQSDQLQVTVDGDSMKISNIDNLDAGDPAEPQRSDLVFRKFDCP